MDNDKLEAIQRKDGIEYRHPAMVTVQFSRVRVGGISLFGSEVEHHTVIALRVSQADVKRELSQDWIHGDIRPIIEVFLSPTQFSDLLTTMNVGTGVPGTLRYHDGEHFSSPEMPSKGQQFRAETLSALTDTMSQLRKAHSALSDALCDDKPMGKKAKAELASMVASVERLVSDKLPFIMNQFSRQMARVVVEAKGEVDAFVNHAITSAGLEAIRSAAPVPQISMGINGEEGAHEV